MIKNLSSEQLEDFLLSTCVDETGVPGNGTLWEFSNGVNVLTYEGHRHVFLWKHELLILDKETDSLDVLTNLHIEMECTLSNTSTVELSTMYEMAQAIEDGSIGITDRVERYLTNKPKSSRYSYSFSLSTFNLFVNLTQSLNLSHSMEHQTGSSMEPQTGSSTLRLEHACHTVGTVEINDTTTVHQALKLLTRRFINRQINPLLNATSVKSEADIQSESSEDSESLDDILDQVSRIPGMKTVLGNIPKDSFLAQKIRNGDRAVKWDITKPSDGTRLFDIKIPDTPEDEDPGVNIGDDFVETSRTLIVGTPASSEEPPIDEVMRQALADFKQE